MLDKNEANGPDPEYATAEDDHNEIVSSVLSKDRTEKQP